MRAKQSIAIVAGNKELGMSYYKVKKSALKGKINIPPSKSHTVRAVLFAALAEGKSIIHNYLASPDTEAIINACRLFGADIKVFANSIEVVGTNGQIHFAEDVINAGNSGLTFRFATALGALCSNPVVVTGDYSIRHYRPIQPLLDGLNQLGVETSTLRGDNHAPVIVQGPIKGGEAHIISEDAQYASSLIIASAFAKHPIEIHVSNPGERPWIDVTLSWLDRLGIPYQRRNYEYYKLKGQARYKGFEYTVPGDFSTAAFPIAAALITQSELTISNLDMADVQGDKELIFQLQRMGAHIEIDEGQKSVHVKKSTSLKGMPIDVNNFVDAVPILAVIGCFAEGETRILNAEVVKYKECNRLHCITSELKKMGADITETSDGLVIRKTSLKGAHMDSYCDHRMALALAVAALTSEKPSTITPVECVSKTFPSFVHDFTALGAHLEQLP